MLYNVSPFFSRCIEDLVPTPLENYDILLSEHAVNDNGGNNKQLPELYPIVGVSREQLYRRVLSINPNMVILLPEMWLGVVKVNGSDFILGVCSNETNGIEDETNWELAKHYQLPAVVKFTHVICENISSFQPLSYAEKLKMAKSYSVWKGSKPDSHPSEVIHRMMGEFLLFFFQRSLEEYMEDRQIKRISQSTQLPSPLYNETILFDKDFDSQCRSIIKAEDQLKFIRQADNLDKGIASGIYNFTSGFRPATRKFQNRPFQVGLSIFVESNGKYPAFETKVEAIFKFNNDSKIIGPIDFVLAMPAIGYNFRIVEKLNFSKFTQKAQLQFSGKEEITLSSLQVTIFKSPKYIVLSEVVIVEYESINKT